MKTYGARERILAKLIEAGEDGVTDLGLSFAAAGSGNWEKHVESLMDDGYPSIKVIPEPDPARRLTDSDVRVILPPRAVEAAKVAFEIDELRTRMIEEDAARGDDDRPFGYNGDPVKVRAAMSRSISGSLKVKEIMRQHGFTSYDTFADFPESAPVIQMVNAAWPMEAFRRTEREHEEAKA